MKKSRVFLVLLVLLVTLLAGCANQNGEGAAIADIRQLDGQTIGVMTGSTFDQHTDTYINDAKKEYYTTYADMALAVEQGKIAAFLMDEPMARVLCAENPGVTYLEDYLTEDGYAFAFPKTEQGALLRDQLNEFLARIQSDGTLDVRNALGERGSVYLTVPACGQGTGKVNVTVQEQLREFEAVTEERSPIPTGSEIVVVGLTEDGTLVVSPFLPGREEV